MVEARFSMTRFARFLGAGGLGVLLYYLILYTLTEFLGFWYMVSAGIASVVNYSCNFLILKYWAFKNRSRGVQQGWQYAMMSIGLQLVNLLLLYGLVEYVAVREYLVAQLLATVVITLASYVITTFIFTTPTDS
jgi:putative flippase GtrA